MQHLALNMQRQIVDDVMEGSFHGHSGCTHMSAAAKIGSDFAHIYLFLRTKRNLCLLYTSLSYQLRIQR